MTSRWLWQVRGLYRGATPSFLGMAFESSLLFGIYSQTKQLLQVCTICLLFELSVCCFYSALNDNHKSFPSIIPLILFLKRVVYLSNTYELLFFSKIKGGVQSGGPQPNVIIPSAAFGGSIISFVLCPSELVKVSELESYLLHSIFPYKQLLPILCLWHWASQCRMQVQGTDSLVPKSVRYTSPLDCALRTVKQEGVSKSLTYCILKHMYHLELMD